MLKACVIATLVAAAIAAPPTSDFGKDIQCANVPLPTAENASLPKFVVNLDLPPEQRWKELVASKNESIIELRNALVSLVSGVFDGALLTLIDDGVKLLGDTLPSPYKEEMQSLSDMTGMPFGEVVLYNVFYEFFTVCTSIVAQAPNGDMFHARNLDFGLFLGWDKVAHTWSMTQVLRKNVVEIDWQKGGKTIFKSVNFAGYVGAFTAVNPGKVSLSINERFSLNGGFLGLYQWITGDHTLGWIGFLGRDIFEQQMDHQAAIDYITKTKLIAPAYFIVGGPNSGDGAILTKDRNSDTADVYTMKDNGKDYADWYVLETNYDHWEAPPFFDDRRTSGHKCMLEMGQNGVGFQGIWNVLSTQPNLNKLTAYTAIMNVKTGEMQAYLQDCTGDCTPW